MRRLLLILLLPLLACNGLSTPTPGSPAPTVDPATPTTPPPIPASPTPIPPTDEPAPAPTFPDPNAYTWQLIASGLDRPVDIQPDGTGRLFIIEKLGHIHVFQNGALVETPFLNIEGAVNNSGNEMGLLGMAFHPEFEQNGYFYVNYTGAGRNTFISRFQAGGDTADPATEAILLTIDQPFPNHNGGAVIFGPDGYLYLGLGDGGSAGDPFANGQSLDTLLGKVLRIDVDSGEPYSIPADNPFNSEIWAYGLRNPWRISFDTATGDLFIGDVGQGEWEEIDVIPAGSAGGQNFGWDHREGAHDYEGGGPAGMIDPIAEYSHDEGECSVTGGYVYRGAMPEWNGVYLYGDYCTGYIWGLVSTPDGWQNRLLFDTPFFITSFGRDENGELYLADDNGGVYMLVRK